MKQVNILYCSLHVYICNNRSLTMIGMNLSTLYRYTHMLYNTQNLSFCFQCVKQKGDLLASG